MNPRQVIEKAHNKEYQAIPPLVRPYIKGIDSSSLAAIVKEIEDYFRRSDFMEPESYVSGKDLAKVAYEFHERAGTLTDRVQLEIKKLEEDFPRLRLAHQINLFLSMAVTGQLIQMHAISKALRETHGIDTVELYLALDYDVAEDRRFRVSHFPDISRHGGTLAITGAVSKRDFNKPMWAIPKPSRELVRSWLEQVKASGMHNLLFLKRSKMVAVHPERFWRNFDLIEETIWYAYERSESLVEFNAIFLSVVVNRFWNLPVIFLLGSRIQPYMRRGHEVLLRKYGDIREILYEAYHYFREQGITIKGSPQRMRDAFPFWFVCPHCHARLEMRREDWNSQKVKVFSHCRKCNLKYEFTLGKPDSPDLSMVLGKVAPRIFLDNLNDFVSLGIVGGSGYIGQAEHLLLTNYVAKRIGYVLSPQILYSPRVLYNGITEIRSFLLLEQGEFNDRVLSALRWIYTGRASLLYYLVNFGPKLLYTIWCAALKGKTLPEFGKILSCDECDKVLSTLTRKLISLKERSYEHQ